jgi:hypothetical protein
MLERSALARYLVHESQLVQQLQYPRLPTGIGAFDAAVGGLPRGAVTEIWGPASSGKSTFTASFLAQATAAGEFCALIDADDAFDPSAAARAGADLSRLLWVRCRGAEQALKAADLLIHAGGWGVVAMDISGLPAPAVRRIPVSWWYRFRRAVEHTPTSLVVVQTEPYVKNCAVLAVELRRASAIWSGHHPRFRVLRSLRLRATPRKPIRSREAEFEARALA